jgi:hypothetical protein
LTTEPVYLFFFDATVIKVKCSLCAKLLMDRTNIDSDVFELQRSRMEPQRIVKLQLVVIADSREVMIDHLVNWVIHLMNWVI